jgi:SAM-dependent methyltransferase
MRLITSDDIIETYCKIIQRGSRFFLSKFTFNKQSRTKSAFNDTAFESANWWIMPAVRRRWNAMITGDEQTGYEHWLVERYAKGRGGLKLLSIGSGVCSHELVLAGYPEFAEVTCVDIAQNLLDRAEAQARAEGKTNMRFLCADIRKHQFGESSYDFVLFHASLHHFENVGSLLGQQVMKWLKPDGLVVVNEYVGPNRQQFPRTQVRAINICLAGIDRDLRRRFKTGIVKHSFSGPGWLRMVIADPSECVDSENILPALRSHFEIREEKPLGGNIVCAVLKDIAHHFVTTDEAGRAILEKIFEAEDRFLETHDSDYLFGVYAKRPPTKRFESE